MLENMRRHNWKTLQAQLEQVVCHLTELHFSSFCPPGSWRPAINAYRLDHCIQICVDLAGVAKESIDLQVEHNRLLLRGKRPPPEPAVSEQKTIRILTMEIDCGEFQRAIQLPIEVDQERITAEQRNGLLWIYLPLKPHA